MSSDNGHFIYMTKRKQKQTQTITKMVDVYHTTNDMSLNETSVC